jgi:hypothetical protein
MKLAKSLILKETGSVRQAISPLGHDLLYYYDIALGNLRGLSAISVLEWLVVLDILFGLVRLLVQARLDGGRRRVGYVAIARDELVYCIGSSALSGSLDQN